MGMGSSPAVMFLLGHATGLSLPRTITCASSSLDKDAIKQSLAQLGAETMGGAAASKAQHASALGLVVALEQSREPASWAELAPLLQGEWDQVYTDNAEAGAMWSNGRFTCRKLKGPISGRVRQCISYEELLLTRGAPPRFSYAQRARAPWALGLMAEMRASVHALDDSITWKVSFDTFGWSLLGGLLPLGRPMALPAGAGCEWRMTYVDCDTRILRSQNNRGGPPTMYVLRKA